MNTFTAQTHEIEHILKISDIIVDFRELNVILSSKPLYKLIQQFPKIDEKDTGAGIFTSSDIKKKWKAEAAPILKQLIKRKYCRVIASNQCVLTWKFRTTVRDDFELTLPSQSAAEVYHYLEKRLWLPLPQSEGVRNFLNKITSEKDFQHQVSYRITKDEYWFRQGAVVSAVRFSAPPSRELIRLIEMVLEEIRNEKMQNYIHIASFWNADSALWADSQGRSSKFFEIIEHLLAYTHWIFDMESYEISISTDDTESMFAKGYLRMDFAQTGEIKSQFESASRRLNPGGNFLREFTVNDIALRASGVTGVTSMLNLRMVSRSNGNVDPKTSRLTHRFLKFFVEAIGKIIDIVIPIVHREKALDDLRWRYFLDTHRLKALENGENLYQIITSSVSVLSNFYGIFGVEIFSEGKNFLQMVELFYEKDSETELYTLLDNPLSPADILKNQLMVFPLREVPGGRILLYFRLPQLSDPPTEPCDPNQYLMGTELWMDTKREALAMGIEDTKDYLFFIITECLASTPKVVISNLSRRLPVRGKNEDTDKLMRLSVKILDLHSRFLDFLRTFQGILESGLAYLRGRRDNLTGLYNRQYVTSLIDEILIHPRAQLGLMFIDMDNFKIYNDTVNHDFGDKLLRSLARRIVPSTNSDKYEAFASRFGGDEFCFAIYQVDLESFEEISREVFNNITREPLNVRFYFTEQPPSQNLEINLISFLHRLMRPDVGSRQASRTEYIGKPRSGAREHVIDIWRHYQTEQGAKTPLKDVQLSQIVDEVSRKIEDKIIYNKIFPKIDPEFSTIIKIFIDLQIKNQKTDGIQKALEHRFKTQWIERKLTLKISAGLAHSSENQLRSRESLFKAADNRAYLAKHNGRNCLIGADGRRLD